METEIHLLCSSAHEMRSLSTSSVDLVVTSPPYPMIAMWDSVFGDQDDRIRSHLEAGKGSDAFESMHQLLDRTWMECDRLLKPGGIACINIGDATRTIDGDFQLYSNHSRILKTFLDRGYAALPDILWRKQTNAPNKFMGSGMLPVGAYVTYEHEYVLVLRKERRRQFRNEEEKKLRRQSAFFWEERNTWFSDVWYDIKGTPQTLVKKDARDRSAAFPFELAYRLISMFSIKKDVVLDPFAGTGTTLAAALATGRSAIGVEIDSSLVNIGWKLLAAIPEFANRYTHARLLRHMQFAAERTQEGKPLKHTNRYYQFPVMTSQETELLISDVVGSMVVGTDTLRVEHSDFPQEDLVEAWDKQACQKWNGGDGEKGIDPPRPLGGKGYEQRQLESDLEKQKR